MTQLLPEEKQGLEERHSDERDGRIRDRIKAVLLRDEGWSITQISQALRLHYTTIIQHLKDYDNQQKLKPQNGGSESKLSLAQSEALISHIEENCYTKVKDICGYVLKEWDISYTVAGMHSWLKQHKFTYKKPKETPAKADPEKQREFIDYYNKLLRDVSWRNEPIFFIDSVHPTCATKVSYGWIRRGCDKLIKATASRTRINITGAINVKTMDMVAKSFATINGETTVEFLKRLEELNPKSTRIHVILDQSGYHRSKEVSEFEKNSKIKLHFLPPYSPNLNPIERLWKVMNEYVRNNRYFASAKEFRQQIFTFFDQTYGEIGLSLKSRINDNFHLPNIASSV